MHKLWHVRHVWTILKQGVSLDQTSGPHKDRVMAPLSSYEAAEETEKTARAVNHSSLGLVHAACWMKGEAQGRCVWATLVADERGSRWTLVFKCVTKSGLSRRQKVQDESVDLYNPKTILQKQMNEILLALPYKNISFGPLAGDLSGMYA